MKEEEAEETGLHRWFYIFFFYQSVSPFGYSCLKSKHSRDKLKRLEPTRSYSSASVSLLEFLIIFLIVYRSHVEPTSMHRATHGALNENFKSIFMNFSLAQFRWS